VATSRLHETKVNLSENMLREKQEGGLPGVKDFKIAAKL
jgi:hypothetical protein